MAPSRSPIEAQRRLSGVAGIEGGLKVSAGDAHQDDPPTETRREFGNGAQHLNAGVEIARLPEIIEPRSSLLQKLAERIRRPTSSLAVSDIASSAVISEH